MLVWTTPKACAARANGGRLLNLSGTYEFQGSLSNTSGRSVAIAGNLDFDWLGDISGEAHANMGQRRSLDTGCDLLLMGNYTPEQGAYLATLTLTPVTNCPFPYDERLQVRITPDDADRSLYLNQVKPGRWAFAGVAKMESIGPVSAIEMLSQIPIRTRVTWSARERH